MANPRDYFRDFRDAVERAGGDPTLDPVNGMELPDCRLARPKPPTVELETGHAVEFFCGSCGKLGGWVTEAWCAHMFYLCPDCERYGLIPGAVPVPDEVVRPGGLTPEEFFGRPAPELMY